MQYKDVDCGTYSAHVPDTSKPLSEWTDAELADRALHHPGPTTYPGVTIYAPAFLRELNSRGMATATEIHWDKIRQAA